jgi:endonuclease III
MNRQQRAEAILAHLDELYPAPPIPLDHRDPYSLLIAVLLSAQCTDKMVNQVTPDLWRLADNPAAMSQVDEQQILQVIRRLGLAPRKAKAIKELSRLLVEQHHGQVPQSFADLEELPGVGHKTASVVMCQAFGVPAFPVDTHIHRLAQRWRNIGISYIFKSSTMVANTVRLAAVTALYASSVESCSPNASSRLKLASNLEVILDFAERL